MTPNWKFSNLAGFKERHERLDPQFLASCPDCRLIAAQEEIDKLQGQMALSRFKRASLLEQLEEAKGTIAAGRDKLAQVRAILQPYAHYHALGFVRKALALIESKEKP